MNSENSETPGRGPGAERTADATRPASEPAADAGKAEEPDPRDEARQFALPLVVRMERATPPGRTDALQTAARAVLVLLDDARSHGDGEWAEAVRDWQDARIRKVVRRARGGQWRKAESLPGVTVRGESAEVRVFPPVPLDGWPKELSVLQVSGTELDDAHPPAPPAPEAPVLWLNPEVTMSAGKAMAQAGHGAQLAWWELDEGARARWRASGFALSVRRATPAMWRELTAAGLPVVRDAGFTEIAPGSPTVVADHRVLRA